MNKITDSKRKKMQSKNSQRKIHFGDKSSYRSEEVFETNPKPNRSSKSNHFKRSKREQLVISCSETSISPSKSEMDEQEQIIDEEVNFNFEQFSKSRENSITQDVSFIEITQNGDDRMSTSSSDSSQVKIISSSYENDPIVIDDDISSSDQNCDADESGDENITVKKSIDACFYDLPSCKIIVIPHYVKISVYGLMKFHVIHGVIDVNGHTFDRTSKDQDLFCPRGTSLLTIRNTSPQERNDQVPLTSLSSELSDRSIERVTIPHNYAVVGYEVLIDPKMKFVEKFISQRLFPRSVTFEPSIDDFGVLNVDEAWYNFVDSLIDNDNVILTGGKNVGKSTMLRFCVNRLLGKCSIVRVIDLDPGQAEFTPPGCISVVHVTEPLLGPGYTHQLETELSILSDINVGNNPMQYLNAVKFLADNLPSDEMPTIINTMGFTRGIGINIVSAIITLLKPTVIVQIDSNRTSNNFPRTLKWSIIKEKASLFFPHPEWHEFRHVPFRAYEPRGEIPGWKAQGKQMREMAILSYFGQMMNDSVQSLTSHQLPIYEVHLSAVTIWDVDGNEIPIAAAIANLVSLCRLVQPKIFETFGYGVLRSVDLKSRKMFVVTPVNENVLEQVTCLVVSNKIQLPASVYMTVDDLNGKVPYVLDGQLTLLGQMTKRSYIPTNSRRTIS